MVVGAGISGLAAAAFWRAARPGARILILDNHDDFGGHARRNEYRFGDRTLLMNGGTMLIDSPRPYGAVAAGLLARLGVRPARLQARHADPGFWARQGMGRGVFLDRENFGGDVLATGIGRRPWAEALRDAPIPVQVRDDIVRLHDARIDHLPGLAPPEKQALLARTSYRDYLARHARVGPAALPFFQSMSHGEWGVGADAVSALDVSAFGFPGFQGLGLPPGPAPGMGYTAAGYAAGGSERFHFPDGNASIARLLVRRLIPGAIPGRDAEDVVLARADYTRLDRAGAPVRIRLESTALRVRNAGTGVEVVYRSGGATRQARAAQVVLACWGMVIPFLCPELPAAQAAALRSQVKVPLVYASVLLRGWQAFRRLGMARVQAPGGFFSSLRLDWKTRIGGYDSLRGPEEPVLLFLSRVPCAPGLDARSQHRAGRAELLAMPFERFELELRGQLQRMLGAGGFDAARDILGITVNRWPHGYAYEYNPLFDPPHQPGQAPHEIGRARLGRIAIANSDAGAAAYTDSAIDQAHRAVRELLVG
ncbi:NAD(P)-binding protein [Dankookia sp. GCM10030260]|uniref:NAD(P)-binding protein n=1 Tax=Dankookia sp. GCM10030260 TaxID=3273390 RepID=UPI00361BEB47